MIKLLKLLYFLSFGLLVSCGPPAPQFSILETSQGAYQGNTSNNKVDILWVVDNSGSMLTKQQSLATSFSSFTSVFINRGFDFNMAILTTDTRTVLAGGQESKFQGTPTVLSQTVSNWSSTFQTNVVVGFNGDSDAKPLDAVINGLSTANLAGDNAGFLRSSAHLAVIFVTDADDDDESTNRRAALISFLDALKPAVVDPSTGLSKRNYTLNAVAVDTSNGQYTTCGAPYENGLELQALVAATEGSFASICEADFSSGLTTLSNGIAEVITQLPLKRAPNTSTITVTFNGAMVPNNSTNGWTYVSSGQKIVFHGTYIPTDGTSINVSYTPQDIIR